MHSLLRFLLWLMRTLVFVGLLGLAIKNSGTMELHFFFGHSWQLPISVVVLASFAAGVLLGLVAIAGGRWRPKSQDQR